jgi:hypothetical protein
MFSQLEEDYLEQYLANSSFLNGNAINLNFSSKGLNISIGSNIEYISHEIMIAKPGLNQAEIVLNISNVSLSNLKEDLIVGWIKFEANCIPPSIIAEDVTGLKLDLKEAYIDSTIALKNSYDTKIKIALLELSR